MNIDELVVQLTLDGSAFKQGSEEAIREQERLKARILAAQDAVAKSLGMTETELQKVGAAFRQRQEDIKVAQAAHQQLMGLTVAEYRTYRNEAARTAAELESRGKQGAEFFSQIRNQALALFAVLVGGKDLAGFVAKQVNQIPGVGRAAVNIGIPVRQLEAYRNTIERAGGSPEAAQAELQGIAQELQNQRTGRGNPEFRQGLLAIGATGSENPLQIAQKFAVFAGQHQGDTQLINQIGGQLLHFSQGTINELAKGPDQFRKDMQESLRQGLPTAEQVKAVAELNKEWIDLTQTVTALGERILGHLAPALTEIIHIIDDFIKDHPKLAAGAATAAGAGGAVAAGWGVAKTLRWLRGSAGAAEALIATEAAPALASGGSRLLAGAAGPLAAFIAAMWPTSTASPEMDETRRGAFQKGDGPGMVGAPRGIRNNNPGNLEFRGQPGAVPEPGSGRFAAFGNLDQGINALASQLRRYQAKGIDTISSIISTYAPSTENNTPGYITSVAADLGISPQQRIDINDPRVLHALIRAITRMEVGKRWAVTDAQIDHAQGVLQSQAADLRSAALNAPAIAQANNSNVTTNQSSVLTHINGPINIQAPTGDAQDIANSFRSMHAQFTNTAQANTGLN